MQPEDSILKEKHFDAAMSPAVSPTTAGRAPEPPVEDEKEREDRFPE